METGNINLTTIASLAAMVSTVAGAYMKIRKINADHTKQRKVAEAALLQKAKEEDAKIKAALESKIMALDAELSNFKESVEKDFSHVRETYNGEIRNLGDKIEDLRTELRGQFSQMVSLLTKMIDKE
jgi:hypothetical protein